MITIEDSTVNIYNSDMSGVDDLLNTKVAVVVRDELVNMLRIISEDERFLGQTVLIPNDCEQHGFAEGKFDLPTLLYFLADMLE